MRFHKFHGLGNDFVLIDDADLRKDLRFAAKRNHPSFSQWVARLCDRHFGIGCDQVIWLTESKSKAHFTMNVINADGSEASMCGNGIRAAGLYWVKTRGYTPGTELRVHTGAGLKQVTVQSLEPAQIRVDMGTPKSIEHGVALHHQTWSLVDVGNPHAICDQPLDRETLEKLGPLMESDPKFPERTNVEFAQVANTQTVELKVFERGAGWTKACGTGACATAVALIDQGKVKSPAQINLPGGSLSIEWHGSGPVIMTGPATWVCSGDLTPEFAN